MVAEETYGSKMLRSAVPSALTTRTPHRGRPRAERARLVNRGGDSRMHFWGKRYVRLIWSVLLPDLPKNLLLYHPILALVMNSSLALLLSSLQVVTNSL